MEDGWSWRYTLNGVTLDGANAGAGAVEVTVTGLELNELYELAYFADRSSPYWLNYHSDVVANEATVIMASLKFDIAEGKKSYTI